MQRFPAKNPPKKAKKSETKTIKAITKATMYRDSKHRCMREKLQGHGKPYQIGQKEEEEEDEKKKKVKPK